VSSLATCSGCLGYQVYGTNIHVFGSCQNL